MRARKSGHILNLTSIAGLVAFPGSGLYNASKSALEGFTEALHHEAKPFDIRVTPIEPGAFRTGFAGSAAMRAAGRIADYAPLDAEYYATQNGQQMGDPVKGTQVVVDMVESDTAPVRLMLGEDAYQLWEGAVASRNRDLAKWRVRGEDTAIPGALKNYGPGALIHAESGLRRRGHESATRDGVTAVRCRHALSVVTKASRTKAQRGKRQVSIRPADPAIHAPLLPHRCRFTPTRSSRVACH